MNSSDIKFEEDVGMPGGFDETLDMKEYQVKYLKVNMDSAGEVNYLEALETKAILGDGDIAIVSRDKFSFQDEFFVVLCYLERKGKAFIKSDNAESVPKEASEDSSEKSSSKKYSF